jgi:hypothetical protein
MVSQSKALPYAPDSMKQLKAASNSLLQAPVHINSDDHPSLSTALQSVQGKVAPLRIRLQYEGALCKLPHTFDQRRVKVDLESTSHLTRNEERW